MTLNRCDADPNAEVAFLAMIRELNLNALERYLPNPGMFVPRPVESLCDAVRIEGTGPAYPCDAAIVNLNLPSGYQAGQGPTSATLHAEYLNQINGRGYQPTDLVGYLAAKNYAASRIPVAVYGTQNTTATQTLGYLGIPCFIGDDAAARAFWAVLLIHLCLRERVCFYNGQMLAMINGNGRVISVAGMIEEQINAIFSGQPSGQLTIVAQWLKSRL